MEEANDQLMLDVDEDNKAAVFQQIQLRRQLITCVECEQGFESVSRLESHVAQMHVGWLPFECRYCLTFKASESDIRTHTRMRHRGHETKFVYSPDDSRRQRVNVIMQQSLSHTFPFAAIDSNGPRVFGTPAPRSHEFSPYSVPQRDSDPYNSRSMPSPMMSRNHMTSIPMAPAHNVCSQLQTDPTKQFSNRAQQQPVLRMPVHSRLAFQWPPQPPNVPFIDLGDDSMESGESPTLKQNAAMVQEMEDPSVCQLCTLIGHNAASNTFIATDDKVRHGKFHLAQDNPNGKHSAAEILQKLQQCFPKTSFALQPKPGVPKQSAPPVVQNESGGTVQTAPKQSAPEVYQEIKMSSKLEGDVFSRREPTKTSSVIEPLRQVPCAECKQPVNTNAFAAHVRSCHMKGTHSKCSHCDFASDDKATVERHFTAHSGLPCTVMSAPTTQQVEYKIRRCFGRFLNSRDATGGQLAPPAPSLSAKKVAKKNGARSPKVLACNLCRYETAIKGRSRQSHVYDHLLKEKGMSIYTCEQCGVGATTLFNMKKHTKICEGGRMKVDKDSITKNYKNMFKKCWDQ